jgi:hypothetical protein
VLIARIAWQESQQKGENRFSHDVKDMQAAFNTNTLSVWEAVRLAVDGFDTLPADVPKSFIYTGNMQNVVILPQLLFITLGLGKAATSYLLGAASLAFKDKGYKYVRLRRGSLKDSTEG